MIFMNTNMDRDSRSQFEGLIEATRTRYPSLASAPDGEIIAYLEKIHFGRVLEERDFTISCYEPFRSRIMPPPSLPARRSWLYLKSVFSARFTPAHYVRKSDMESYIIGLTFSGAGRLEYEGKTYALTSGEGFIVDCRRPFYCRAASPSGWGYHGVIFDGFPMGDYFSLIKNAGGVTFSLAPETSFYRILDRLYEANRRFDRRVECVNSCLITNILTEILMNLSPGGAVEAPERITALREYLEEHYTKNITMEALARRFAMSRYHLSREFKKHTGVSPSEYLMSLRMDHAKRLLRFTNLKISRVALEAGCPDSSRFFSLFKKRESVSPGEYRKRYGMSPPPPADVQNHCVLSGFAG